MWLEEKEEYWKKRKERISFNVPSLGEEIYTSNGMVLVPETGPKMPEELQVKMIDTLKWFFGSGVRVEVFTENESVRFRVLSGYNPKLITTSIVISDIEKDLSELRKRINDEDSKFKKCKLFFLKYDCEPEMNSFNVVFNANWRKYENYEILFRSKTQLRRAREY